MDFAVIKLIAAPTMLVASTLAIRRWGGGIGGLLVGLPLTSGPISLFLAIEHGAAFARSATTGSLIATSAQAAFVAAYAALARAGMTASIIAAIFAFAGTSAALQAIGLNYAPLFLIAILAIIVALRLIPHRVYAPPPPLPWWDLPLRATIILVLAASVGWLAPALGPATSGVMASIPFIGTILAAFAHRHSGAGAATEVLRGMTFGLFGFTAFFAFLHWALIWAPLPVAYVAAILISIASQAGAYSCAAVRRSRQEGC